MNNGYFNYMAKILESFHSIIVSLAELVSPQEMYQLYYRIVDGVVVVTCNLQWAHKGEIGLKHFVL